MYETLGSQILDYLDEYKVKDTYNFTWTEVNTILTKAASALSNLVKTKPIETTDINDILYGTACAFVLNLYFWQNIDVIGSKFSNEIQNEIVRNEYAKTRKK
jgi:hypothetical protein